MKRIAVLATATLLAAAGGSTAAVAYAAVSDDAVPTGRHVRFGGEHQQPSFVRSGDRVIPVTAGDDHRRPRHERGDDGRRGAHHREAGDDHGRQRTHVEAGDDHGGLVDRDDRVEAGDDHGGRHGGDDGGRHGGDDRGGDDHGGHGSDD